MRAALDGSHQRWVRVIAAGPGGSPVEVPVVDGSVTWQAGSYTRCAARFTVAGLALAPAALDDPLAPVGSRVLIDMGVGLPGGHVEHVRVASLWVESVDLRRPDELLDVQAVSRAARVSAAGLPAAAQPAPGQTALQMIRSVVEQAVGAGVTHVTAGVADAPAPADSSFTGDPWQAVEALSDTLAAETFFDREDRLVTRPVPVLATPAAVLDAAASVTATWGVLDRSRFANHVRLVFTGPAGEIVGEAKDDAAGSPTRWGGPAGKALYEETRPGPVTQAEADAAAARMLVRILASFERCGVEMVPDPTLELGDTVMLRHADGRAARYLVSAVTLPLGPGAARVELNATAFGSTASP